MPKVYTIGLVLFLLLFLMASITTSAHAQNYTGWWWDPDASGTGYALEVQEAPDKDYDLAYMVWYLYDDSGLNTWYSAVMRVTGSEMVGELVEYSGWPLESGVVGDTVVSDNVGIVRMSFSDEDTGILTYTVYGNNNFFEKTLQRWEPEGEHDPRDLTGWWWDTDRQGIGWFIEARNNRLFPGWYNYRQAPEGMPRWYISLDNDFTSEDTLYSESLLDYSSGQTLTGDYVEPTFETLEELFSFNLPSGEAPENIGLTYDGITYNLTRFTIPDVFGSGCAPEVVVVSPDEGVMANTYRPLIKCRVKTSCGSAIDTTSIQM